MTVIGWSPEMSVGSEVLDGHHRMILDCLARLEPLLGSHHDQAELLSVLGTLEDFILVHFSEEEQAMKRAGYPDWRAHKELHDKMYDVVFDLKSDVERGKELDAQALFDLIYGWLIKHIMGEDRKYMPYLENPHPEDSAEWHWSSGREV